MILCSLARSLTMNPHCTGRARQDSRSTLLLRLHLLLCGREHECMTWHLAGQCTSTNAIIIAWSSFTCQQRPRSLQIASQEPAAAKVAVSSCCTRPSVRPPSKRKSCGGASFGSTAHWHSTAGSHASHGDEAGGRTIDMVGARDHWFRSLDLVCVKRRTGNARLARGARSWQ
jgi:hypothetical protein